MTILIILVIILLAILVALTLWLPSFVMTGERQSLEEAFRWQSERYDTSFYEGIEKSMYTVVSYDGYELHAELLYNPEKSTKYVIISHGYTDNRMGALKYASMYLKLGYNCIIYDLRGHGENEATFTTYGIREGKDLGCLIKDTRKRYTDITTLGIHGESLGAATTISSMKDTPQIDFAVSDCGFSDIEGVLKQGYRNAHVPVLFVDLADIGARIRYHYAIKDMRPIDALNENEVPVLFIHGGEDELIVPQNSQDMYRRTKGYSECHIIPGAGHAESILASPERYGKIVKEFLKKVTG